MNSVKFLRRMEWGQKDLAEKLNCSVALIGSWSSSRAVPSYEKIIELIKLGMSLQELFGDEVAEIAIKSSEKKKEYEGYSKISPKEALEIFQLGMIEMSKIIHSKGV